MAGHPVVPFDQALIDALAELRADTALQAAVGGRLGQRETP